jgi:hypothetical protein
VNGARTALIKFFDPRQRLTDCARKEFKGSERHVFRLLEAAQIEKTITDQLVSSKPVPESQLRELTGLEPEKQREVYKKAVETAPNGKVTARSIREIAKGIPFAPWLASHARGYISEVSTRVSYLSTGDARRVQGTSIGTAFSSGSSNESTRNHISSIEMSPTPDGLLPMLAKI